MAKLPSVSPEFKTLYSETFMDDGDLIEARWKGVVETASEAGLSQIEALVRLSLVGDIPANALRNQELQDALDAVVTKISGGNERIDLSKDKRELQILSTFVLKRMFRVTPDAALAVTTASFEGARKPDLPIDIIGQAEHALPLLSHGNHNRSGVDDLKVVAPKVVFTVAKAAGAETGEERTEEEWERQFSRLKAATNVALDAAAKTQNQALRKISRRMLLKEEELQILWWLIGGRSITLNKPFDKVDEALRPISFAAELAEMVSVSPGPASVMELFSRAGIGATKIKFQDVVNAVGKNEVISLSDVSNISSFTTPIHFALFKRAEVDSTDAWQTAWAAMTGLKADASLSAMSLAKLFYRERLLLCVGE